MAAWTSKQILFRNLIIIICENYSYFIDMEDYNSHSNITVQHIKNINTLEPSITAHTDIFLIKEL